MGCGKMSLYCAFALSLTGIIVVDCMAHGWMAPREASAIQNPVVLDEASANRGREVYLDNCAACHGQNIEGMKAGDAGLEIDSPNLKKRLTTHTDGDFFWKIQEGRGDMPSFAEDLSEEEIWDVINYIREESE